MEITFAKRMDSFQEGIFTVLNKKKTAAGYINGVIFEEDNV